MMGDTNQKGFTIIEVTLFVAISGLLMVLLLGGWTTMINAQRYKDSVRGLQTFVQQQYNLVYNVENGRGSDLDCDSTGVTDEGVGDGSHRGTTDCVLMGRFLHIENGETVKVSAIVGVEPDDLDSADNDREQILAYDPKKQSDIGLTESELAIPWGATVVGREGSSDAQSWTIAIIRAPSSGTVHTYAQPIGNEADLSSSDMETLIQDTDENMRVELCLDPQMPLSGGRMGVALEPRSASQSSIRIIGDAEGIC